METIYCPGCREQIPAEATLCPKCGEPTTVEGRREAQQRKAEYLAAAERQASAEAHQASLEQRAAAQEAHRRATYEHSTGRGVCPSCKSTNVKEYTFVEGQSSAGANMACCLGCFLTPWAFLALPFMAGKKNKGLECQYCSHRWRL